MFWLLVPNMVCVVWFCLELGKVCKNVKDFLSKLKELFEVPTNSNNFCKSYSF